MKKISKLIVYAAFCLSLAAFCYLRPLHDDFDRYVYEALIRSSNQPIGDIYRIVKHESPRAEASSVMDSPEHLAQLEPLYAIRPLYIQVTSLLSRAGMGPQAAINLVSSTSLMMCAVIIGLATRQYLYSALLMASPGVMTIGRMGTPDALSSLAVLASYVAIDREKLVSGILLLMLSIWIRTDNVLFVVLMLVWLVWKKRIPALHSIVLGLLSVAAVLWINYLSGNYGWKVLFQYSFVGGRYPAEITPHINIGQYARAVLENSVSLVPQLAPWLLLGFAAWMLSRDERGSLIPIGAASLLHYLMFPSGESRYFAWAFLLTGAIFIRAISETLASDRNAVCSPLPSRTAKIAAAYSLYCIIGALVWTLQRQWKSRNPCVYDVTTMCRARILKAAIVTVFLIYLLQIFSPLRLVGDGIDYLLQASSAADGLGFSVHGHTSMRPAGYPFLIVGLIKAGIGKPWAIVALNCLCLAVGCVAIYFISRNTFALTSEGSYIVCLLTMLSFVVVRQAAQPLSDICFFGLSAACLLLILRSEDHPARKWPLLSLAGALVAVCIAVRTIGIALVPPFIWVSLGGRETVKRVSAWVGKNRALSFGAASVLLLGAILVVPDFQHSRYFQFNEPILMHRGIAGSVRAKLNDHSREWGEIMLNLSATKLPGVLTILIQALGLVGLVVFSCSLWRERTQFAVFFLYLLCFSCVVLIYPWYDSRLWLPVIPYIFIYLFIGLKNRVGVNTLRTLVPAWCVVYGCLGMAALAYSTRLTFLAPEEFANSYGDHNLQSAYRVVFGLPTQGDVATNKDAVYLLRRYGVGR